MLKAGEVIAKTQSAVVLEKLISQFMFNKASEGQAKNRRKEKRETIPFKRVSGLACAAAMLAASGCATTANNPKDPFEGFNRAMFAVNEGLDVVVKPVAQGYDAALRCR
jgi:ABC-type transporter lipoprotein component MlaA